jgi:hypothetical protein
LTKVSKTPKKAARPAKRKRATSRPFPYAEVAEMWAQERTIPEIAKAVGRVGKGDDPYETAYLSAKYLEQVAYLQPNMAN